METVKNPISGAEMIVPSTDLSSQLLGVLDCVTEISNWDNHSDAFGIQQEILEILELQGVDEAKKRVEKIREEIEEVFFNGKTDEVMALLNSATT